MARMTEELAEALRCLPTDSDMIEADQYNGGLRLTCCDGKVVERWGADDEVKHEADCWFHRLTEAARTAEGPVASPEIGAE